MLLRNMYTHVVFLFFSAFLDLQSIRDDEASKELIFFNTLTDVTVTSKKTRVQTLAKQ